MAGKRRNELDLNSVINRVSAEGISDREELQKMVLAAGLTRNSYLESSVKKAILGRLMDHWSYPFNSEPVSGDIDLGRSFTGKKYEVSKQELTKHFLAVGQSGSGKTTLFYSLMTGVGVPFWAFDLKQDYRHLADEMELLVLPWSRLKFNPLRPPKGVPPRRWAQVFAEIFGHSTALLSGSKNFLMKSIIQLYRLYGLFERMEPPYPSLHELQLLIESENVNFVRKTSNYRDTVLNRLEAMNLVAGTVFDCSQGYSTEELLERNVVFEFDGLSRDVQNFLMEILFAYVYEYRLAKNQRGTGLNHLFFLDEGKRVFSVYKERQSEAGIPEIDELTAKMREFGEGLVVADQEASKLTDSLKANTYTKLLLSTGDRKQFEAVTESMNLSQRQKEYAEKLDIGEAIVQSGNSDPFPVDLYNYELEKSVTDEKLERMMTEKWNQLSFEKRRETPEFKKATGPQQSDSSIPDDPMEQELQLSNESDRLLKDIVDSSFKPLTQRYQHFSSSYKGNKAKNELVEHGVVIERHVRTQDGKRKLLQLTDKGRNYIEEELDIDVEQKGRGGVVHRYWQKRVKEAFEKRGWTAKREMFDADVYVNLNDSELVIEVAMGNNQREIDHLKKHLDSEFDAVWIVCRNQDVLEGLKQRIDENDLEDERVVFRLFRDFNTEENLPS
jgi:DNA-binding MarR family transcriptional regulator